MQLFLGSSERVKVWEYHSLEQNSTKSLLVRAWLIIVFCLIFFFFILFFPGVTENYRNSLTLKLFSDLLKLLECEPGFTSIDLLPFFSCSQQYTGTISFTRVEICLVSGLLLYPD